MTEPLNHIVIMLPGFASGEQDVNCLPMQQSFLLSLQRTFPDTLIRVIALEYPHHRKPYHWHGIRVIPLGGRNRGGLQRILLRQRANAELKRIHAEKKIGGLLAFWTGLSAELVTRFGRKYGIPHFSWIMGQDARPGNKYVSRNQYSAEELIALSDSLQERYAGSYGIRPASVITPGAEITSPVTCLNPYRIIGAGSLIPLKRFDLFIEVIAEVRKKIPQIEAVIYGNGPLHDTLQQQINRLGLQQQVQLAGEVPHPELMQKMRESRVLLHPSSFEGFSGVCLEARVAGIPVISYCQPMKEELPGWYTAPDKQAMIKMLTTELMLPAEPVPFEWPAMADTAKQVMSLFAAAHSAVSASASFSAV